MNDSSRCEEIIVARYFLVPSVAAASYTSLSWKCRQVDLYSRVSLPGISGPNFYLLDSLNAELSLVSL